MNINPLKDEPRQFMLFIHQVMNWPEFVCRVLDLTQSHLSPLLICAVEAQFLLIEHHIGSFDRPLSTLSTVWD